MYYTINFIWTYSYLTKNGENMLNACMPKTFLYVESKVELNRPALKCINFNSL